MGRSSRGVRVLGGRGSRLTPRKRRAAPAGRAPPLLPFWAAAGVGVVRVRETTPRPACRRGAHLKSEATCAVRVKRHVLSRAFCLSLLLDLPAARAHLLLMARATTKQAFCIIASGAIRGRVICLPPPSLSSGALGSAAAHMPCAYKTTVLYGFARPSPPRALAVAALAFRRLALRSVRGAAAVGVRTAAIALFLQTFHFIFLPAPLDTRLSLCYNHRRTDGVRLDRFHFITKERDLSSPVLLFFLCPARGKTPRPPCFWLGRGRSWGLSCCRAVLCGSVVCRASVAVGFWRGAASVVFLPPPVSRLYPDVSRVETSAARP